MDSVERFPIQRVTEEGKTDTEDVVTRELPLTIILNNRELVTLLCSPDQLDYLAIGFLFSEGLINSKDEIKKMIVDDQRGVVRIETKEGREVADELIFKRLITSGCGGVGSFYRTVDAQNLAKAESQVKISALEVFDLVKEFQHHSQIYRATGGVHSAALCDNKDILLFADDIGRHNAVDKIFGGCMSRDIPTDDRIIITSGRIPSEILLKVAKRRIPIIVSVSAPTNLGVRLAEDLGVTLVGFVRGKRMNVYTNGWRVVAG
ncbi:formate dehydrogenase accessory sulfurtransferase FdhD [Chloroflexota bacterium]